MVVVTGASGFLGSYSLRFLLKLYPEEPIVGTYCSNNVVMSNCTLVPYQLNRSKEFLTNLRSSRKLYFVHFASTVSFDFNTNYRNDVSAIKDLITDLPKKYEIVKFIYISSVAVETLDSDYAVIKKYIEDLLIKASSINFAVLILRVPIANRNNVIRLIKNGMHAHENASTDCEIIKLAYSI